VKALYSIWGFRHVRLFANARYKMHGRATRFGEVRETLIMQDFSHAISSRLQAFLSDRARIGVIIFATDASAPTSEQWCDCPGSSTECSVTGWAERRTERLLL
jgi:hypothetical protein